MANAEPRLIIPMYEEMQALVDAKTREAFAEVTTPDIPENRRDLTDHLLGIWGDVVDEVITDSIANSDDAVRLLREMSESEHGICMGDPDEFRIPHPGDAPMTLTDLARKLIGSHFTSDLVEAAGDLADQRAKELQA